MSDNEMNISKEFLENVADAKIGFTIAVVLGYCLYKIMAMKHRRSMQALSDSEESTSDIVTTDQCDHYKLVLVIRKDLKMGKGKVAAQCAHAAVAAYKAAKKHPKVLNHWEECGQAKITLTVNSEEELLNIAKQAKAIGVLTNIVHDAGHTQVPANSRTVCAVGPGPESLIDQLTGHLKLF